MEKMTVHNLNEVKALIRESYAQGNENEFQNTKWFSHAGVLICTSKIELTDFELIIADDKSSLIVEVEG